MKCAAASKIQLINFFLDIIKWTRNFCCAPKRVAEYVMSVFV